MRLYNLGEIPSGLTNDEVDYIYSANSIWHTGHDINGKFLPLSFQLDNSFSPVPIYLVSPVVGIFGMNPFTGRLLFALCGIATVVVVYFLSLLLLKKQSLALLSMGVIAVSPWHVHFSRVAYDGTMALFFILFGLYLLLLALEKKRSLLYSIPFIILGFYSYHATKAFLLPAILFTVFYYRKELLQRRKELGLFFGFLVVFLGAFFFITKSQGVNRQEVLVFRESQRAAEVVDHERKVNSAPFKIRQVFNNKPFYFGRVIRENYLEAFSPQFLFLCGETSGLAGIYGTSFRGQLYLIELPLLLLGFYYLLTKRKRIGFLLAGFILLGPIPSAIASDKTYALRSIMMLPFLMIVVSCGMYFLVKLLKENLHKRSFWAAVIGIAILYSFSITSYFYQYNYRYSIYGAESWFRSARDLSEYIVNVKDTHQRIWIAKPNSMLVQYAFYANLSPKLVQDVYVGKTLKMENVEFTGGCIDTKEDKFNPEKYLPVSTIYITADECHKETQPSTRIRQVGEPLRTIWKVYERK